VATTAGGAASCRRLVNRADHTLERAKASGYTVNVHDPHLDRSATPDGPRPRIRRRDHRPHNPAAGPGTPTGI
jgi:hypothetical protein